MKPRHKDIIEFIIEENLEIIENREDAKALEDKLNAIIEKLINKDGILIVANEHEDKKERIISLNVSYNAPLFS